MITAIDDCIVSFDSLDSFSVLIQVTFLCINAIVQLFFIGIGHLALVKERVLSRVQVLPSLGRVPLDALGLGLSFAACLRYVGLSVDPLPVKEVEALEETVELGLDLLRLLPGYAKLGAVTFWTETNLTHFQSCLELCRDVEQYNHCLEDFLLLDTEHLPIVVDSDFIECLTPAL